MKKIAIWIEGYYVYLTEKEYRNLLKDWGYSKNEIDEEIEKNAVEIIPVEEW